MKTIITLFIFLILATPVHAEFTDTKSVACIVGEAADQGPEGMLYIASALRNRGTYQGVHGCTAIHTKSRKTHITALYMWMLSEHYDYARGATEWRSTKTKEDKTRVDWNSMVFIFEYKDHKFYRRIKQKGDN